MKNDFKWILIFLSIIVVCAGIMLFRGGTGGDVYAVVKLDGKIIKRIDLSEIEEPYDFRVDFPGGYNLIRVEKGKIAVIEADCPDKICVHRGFVSNGALPVICLPHRLSITLEGSENSVDAVAGGQ